jgi:hypothetical protein
MKSLLQLANEYLQRSKKIYRAKANLNGVIVELITNAQHQYDFWKDNWHEAPAEFLPHASLYSVNGIPDREPMAYYCSALSTSLFINTEYYGQCKSWALGMAAAIFAKRFNTHSIHGALASYGGKGVVIVAPTGTGKTTQAFKLFLHPEGKIVGDDWAYIRFPTLGENHKKKDGKLLAVQPEKALYMRTETEKDQPWLRKVFDKSKLENVLVDKYDCEFLEGEDHCKQTGGLCVFAKGFDHCYYAFGNSRALVPREALLGKEKVADSANVKLVALLRRDDHNPPEVNLQPDEAIQVLKKGEYMVRPGAGPKEMWGKIGTEPWYNPYLLEQDNEAQERFFRAMFEDYNIPCILLNTGVETVEQTHERILRALKTA